MKKLFSIVVVAALATSFVSCGGSSDAEKAAAAMADSTRKADSITNAAVEAEVVAVPDSTAAPASTEVAAPAGK